MIKKILQGLIVGIGGILPGVSGGMIAAAFNIYGKLMQAIDDLTKHPIKAIKSVWEYLLGATIGMIVGFLLIIYIFNHIPIPSTLFFIGLILGGIPEIYFLAVTNKIKIKEISIIFISFLIMVIVSFLQPQNQMIKDTNMILWFMIGGLLALSITIPGLSGTMLLMMIGYYIPLTNLPNEIISALSLNEISLFFNLMTDALFLGLGFLITLIITSKLFSKVLSSKPKLFYQVILGIVIASPINIIMSLRGELLNESADKIDIFNLNQTWYMWLIGIILLLLGIYIARKFEKAEEK